MCEMNYRASIDRMLDDVPAHDLKGIYILLLHMMKKYDEGDRK